MNNREYEVTVRVTQLITVVVEAPDAYEARTQAERGPTAWIDATLGTSAAETVDWTATSNGRPLL
jgi:hypothetical protein